MQTTAFPGEKVGYRPPKKPGILSCGSCGRRMYLNGSRKGYRCTQAAVTGLDACQLVKRERYALEAEILETVHKKATEELELLKKNKSKWQHEAREWKGTETIQAKADKLFDKKMQLYDRYKSGKLKKDEYLELVKSVTDDLETVRAKLDAIHTAAMTAECNLAASKELEERLKRVKSLKEFDTAVIKLILDTVVINPDGTHEYRWKNS